MSHRTCSDRPPLQGITVLLAAFMTALDTLVGTTALPVLWVQLHAGCQVSGGPNPYNLAFACCLLSDRFGRRRMLGTGLALSTAASAASAPSCGVETSETVCWPAMRTARLSVRIPLARAPGLVAGLLSSAASSRSDGLCASADNAHERAADLLSPRGGTSRRRARSPGSSRRSGSGGGPGRRGDAKRDPHLGRP